MFNRKAKHKDEEDIAKKPKGKSMWPVAFFIGLILSIATYVAMINMEKNALADYDKMTVLTAMKEIPAGEVLNEKNVGTYIQSKEINKLMAPDGLITKTEDLYGKAAVINVQKGMIISENLLKDIDKTIDKMEVPQVVGITVSDISQMVTGIIRTGDIVDIYVVPGDSKSTNAFIEGSNEDGSNRYHFRKVYVYEVFDSSGKRISNSDTSTACARLNVILEEDIVPVFCSAIENGTVYVTQNIE